MTILTMDTQGLVVVFQYDPILHLEQEEEEDEQQQQQHEGDGQIDSGYGHSSSSMGGDDRKDGLKPSRKKRRKGRALLKKSVLGSEFRHTKLITVSAFYLPSSPSSSVSRTIPLPIVTISNVRKVLNAMDRRTRSRSLKRVDWLLKSGVFIGEKTGGLGVVLAVESSLYRRLALLQQFMIVSSSHALSLSPRSLLAPSSLLATSPVLIPSQPLSSSPFLYLPLLLSFLQDLSMQERTRILNMINNVSSQQQQGKEQGEETGVSSNQTKEEGKEAQKGMQQQTNSKRGKKQKKKSGLASPKLRLSEEQIRKDLRKLLWSFSELFKQF
jgi:hypothetical protein